MPNLIEIMKQAAMEANENSMPAAICYGTVQSVEPLKILVEQKMLLDATQLSLSSLVQDFSVEMTVNHSTEIKSGGSGEESFAAHNHAYSGKKTFTVHMGLKSGEKVILLRVQGGQKYMVLDRVR